MHHAQSIFKKSFVHTINRNYLFIIFVGNFRVTDAFPVKN